MAVFPLKHLALTIAILAVMAGCGKSIVVRADFPTPVIDALPLDVGTYYGEPLRTFTYSEALPNDVEWAFELGDSNVRLFDSVFNSLFESAKAVEATGGNGEAFATLDAVIAPRLESFEFSLPRQSRSEQYSVWIRYNIDVHRPDGELISSWPVTAYGQSDSRLLQGAGAMERAVEMAMRDAAATIVIGFAGRPKIREALLDNSDP